MSNGKRPNIITFAIMKGGTGKTTLTFNIGCYLAKDHKVLLMDFDPQCNLSSNMNQPVFDIDTPSVGDVFDDLNISPLDVMVPGPIEELPNLDIIPSTMYLTGVEAALSLRPMREQAIITYIEKNPDFFNYYDYVLIDTNPGMGVINQNAFFACDHIVLVADPDTNSVRSADIFLYLWNEMRSRATNCEEKVDAMILNNVERNNISGETMDYIAGHEKFHTIFLDSKVPHLTAFKESVKLNLPIFLNPNKYSSGVKKGTIAIENVVNELNERGIL